MAMGQARHLQIRDTVYVDTYVPTCRKRSSDHFPILMYVMLKHALRSCRKSRNRKKKQKTGKEKKEKKKKRY